MAEPREPEPVLLIVAAFSRWPEAIGWARDNLQNRYGPTRLESPVFDFVETHYYDDEMGAGLLCTKTPVGWVESSQTAGIVREMTADCEDSTQPTSGAGLKKQFFAFERLIQATELAAIKLWTNQLERLAADSSEWATAKSGVARPINLDPGYLNAGKWVLATTKDQAHRLYLGDGIYAEVTLRYEHGEFVPWPWTYPNYARNDYRRFFNDARAEYLRLARGQRSEIRSQRSENQTPEGAADDRVPPRNPSIHEF